MYQLHHTLTVFVDQMQTRMIDPNQTFCTPQCASSVCGDCECTITSGGPNPEPHMACEVAARPPEWQQGIIYRLEQLMALIQTEMVSIL